jgi:acetyl esterase/lipase
MILKTLTHPQSRPSPDALPLSGVVATAAGTAFAMLPPQVGGPAPTLLLFAMGGWDTLTTEPYCRVGRLLYAQGWNVVSLDLPSHGADVRPGEPEIVGWVARLKQGEDVVASFRLRVNDVIEHLITAGIADPSRIAAAGTSRGGFMAFHVAADNPRICAIAAFAPLTDLLALTEFAGQESNPLVQRLALIHTAEAVADRAAWIIIGNADTRVGTEHAIAYARAIANASQARSLGCEVTLRVESAPGHMGLSEWHDLAADWFLQTVVSTVATLPESGHPLAVPCRVFPPRETSGRKAGLVIHLYGHGGSHQFYNLMRPAYALLRRDLRKAGYWVIVPDLGPSHWMNARTVAVLDAIIADLMVRVDIDPKQVHLLGTSMGGGSALMYAYQRAKVVRSVCSIFPMTDFAAWTTETPAFLPQLLQAHNITDADPGPALRKLSPINHIADFAKTPVFLLHGEADTCVPVHHSRDFAAVLRAAGSPVVYQETYGGHNDNEAMVWQKEIFNFITNTPS